MTNNFLTDGTGSPSSKRLAAVICFAVAIVKTFWEPDLAVISLWIGAGTTLLGLGAITKS
jgi:hypothetical protein